ncbi:hypothetical protein JCM13304A_23140 [Desulfothermus okinawensis JCM 13304]
MQKIPLDKAKTGMVLAKPVLKENGMVLIAQGTELTENHFSILKKQGIKFIVVKGTPLDLGEGAYGFSIKKRLDRLDYIFRKHKNNKWMQKVKEFFNIYFTYQLKKNKTED